MTALPTVRLADLQQARAVVDKEGRPTAEFLSNLNGNTRNIRIVLLSLVEAVEAIQQAQAAAAAANTAAATAQAAAATAQTAAASAVDAIEQIEAGEFDLEAVTVGGQRFVNNGGVLELEP